jgi:AcrR family transcriptional regulator
MGRQDLLDAVIAELERTGIGDRSLRDIASAVGTSHRMLIHHFGSRAGLLTAVVDRIEADQRAYLASLEPSPVDVTVAIWRRLSDPALWPAERLFFECYARAARGEQPYASLLPGLVDDWLDRVVELGLVPSGPAGGPPADTIDERAQARLGLAVFRGLLLDLVATGDRAGVDAGFAAWQSIVEGVAIPADRPPR